MLVESDPHQTRIAVLEDDRLTEIFVERQRHRGLVGNVYKGRVTRVLPGMQAAFVDIGLERDAFLYVSDVATTSRRRTSTSTSDDGVPDPAQGHAGRSTSCSRPARRSSSRWSRTRCRARGRGSRTHVTLPGRYLVLLPTVRHFGVSRAIDGREERERLLGAASGELPADAAGLIVRTVGEGKRPKEFETDLAYL